MLLSRGYLTVQCVMHGAPAPTGVPPSELPVNTCFDGVRTNMSCKGPFECQTDFLRRPHLRPRKGTHLGAGNPSPASCSASSRCQPCAPLARLKKYLQFFRANPSTSTLPLDGACQREALGARSALISHLAEQGQGRSTEAKCDTDDDCCLSQRLRLASIQRLW